MSASHQAKIKKLFKSFCLSIDTFQTDARIRAYKTQNSHKGETMTNHTTKEIRFKQDKNGKRIAQVWNWGASRWVKIGLEKAELMIATGQAEESQCNW